MIGFLGALMPYIPAITSIAGLLLRIFGKSEKEIEEFKDAIRKAARQGSISVDVKDKLDEQKKEIKNRKRGGDEKNNSSA